MTDSTFDLKLSLQAIWRYRLVVACALIVGVVITLTTVHSLSDVYESTTLIMVEAQEIPTNYVKPTLTDSLDKRLQAMNQEVMSRTHLETIINDFDLFPGMRKNGVPMEQLVERMRQQVAVQIFTANNSFRISYQGSDPQTVQRVAARLANVYIDENLRMREAHASGTTEFMEAELEKARRQLEKQEAAVQEFRRNFLGELPEQEGANMQLLTGYQAQLRSTATSLSRAIERKSLLDRQAAELRSTRISAAQAAGESIPTSGSARLQQLEAQLTELRGRYTDEHPDVVQLHTLIDHLRSELGVSGSASAVDPLLPPDLAKALVEAQLEVSRLRQDEDHLRRQIETYQKRVENAFGRNQQMEGLTRDYDVTRRRYQTLLDKKLESQLSQSLEQRQKAERFRVIDPASLPQTPARPNRPLFYAAGIGMSFGLAILLPILLTQLDTSFHSPEELMELAVPVLAVIPQLPTSDVRRHLLQYRLRVLGISAVVLVIGLGSASFYANYVY